MKKGLIPMFCAAAFTGIVACNNSNTDTASQDTMQTPAVNAATGSTDSGSTAMSDNSGFSKGSYVDLKSGKTVKLRRDSATGYATNDESHETVGYYYDPATSDTFDRSGRVVNGAISRGTDNDWTIDESRIKVKTQSDGDLKTKDRETGVKTKSDEEGDKSKIKTDDGKIKIKDGKVKVKPN